MKSFQRLGSIRSIRSQKLEKAFFDRSDIRDFKGMGMVFTFCLYAFLNASLGIRGLIDAPLLEPTFLLAFYFDIPSIRAITAIHVSNVLLISFHFFNFLLFFIRITCDSINKARLYTFVS